MPERQRKTRSVRNRDKIRTKMLFDTQIKFTIPEILSLFGMGQCIFLLVFILFRTGYSARIGLPLAYFFFLGLAFLFDAAQRFWAPFIPSYASFQWLFWFMGPPLSVLLVIQIAKITQTPRLKDYSVLLLIPLAYLCAVFLSPGQISCLDQDNLCFEDYSQLLLLCGSVAGALSLLYIWHKRHYLDRIHYQKTGRERFWLIIMLIIMNIGLLSLVFIEFSDLVPSDKIQSLRTILGLSFVYIASTSLFRIYPHAARVTHKVDKHGAETSLSDRDVDAILKIEALLALDKVYQEPKYSRADFAKELNVSEAYLSRIINIHFQKTFIQVINEHRIEDAKRLLKETDAPVSQIALECGFYSLKTFNRVFKDLVKRSPTEFRT